MSDKNHSHCMNATEEHDMLQLMRGFAILLVVLQHSVVLYFNTNASLIFISICVFIDVHIFMFVSGYLFQKKSEQYHSMGIKQFTLKKGKALMVPYLFWSSLLFFGTYFLYKLSDWYGFHAAEASGFPRLSLTQIFVGLLTYRYFYVQLYWFLFALFWVFIINYVFFKCSCRVEFIVICFVIFSVLAVYFSKDDYILTKIGRSFLTFGFGRLFQKYKLEKIFFKNLTVLIASFATFFLVFKVSVWDGNEYFYKIFFSFRLTLMGMIGIMIFFIFSSFLLSYNSKLTKIMIMLGDYSLPIYLLHNPWIVHVSNMILKKLPVPSLAGTVVSLALGLVLPVLLYKFIIRKNAIMSSIMLGI